MRVVVYGDAKEENVVVIIDIRDDFLSANRMKKSVQNYYLKLQNKMLEIRSTLIVRVEKYRFWRGSSHSKEMINGGK